MPFLGRATLDCGTNSLLPLRVIRGLCPHQPAPRSCTSQAPEAGATQHPKIDLNQEFDRYLGQIYSPEPAMAMKGVLK